VSGEIGEDFTYYYANSEQIPSAVGAGVIVNPDHSVLASGGFIVQVMPGADEETITQIEDQLQSLPAISTLVRQGKTPGEIVEKLFAGEEVNILESLPVNFQCKCSKERVAQAIIGLGSDEIDKMMTEDNGAEATCHFCNERYTFTKEELATLKESTQE